LLTAAQNRGEREKELQNLLVKVKADKDKAVKVIIGLVGKERMSEFLAQHAGSPDILDSMMTHFSADSLKVAGDQSPEKSPSKSRTAYVFTHCVSNYLNNFFLQNSKD
jgi:hypothetical protein